MRYRNNIIFVLWLQHPFSASRNKNMDPIGFLLLDFWNIVKHKTNKPFNTKKTTCINTNTQLKKTTSLKNIDHN